ncbi:MAG: DUF4856 domain-containing protein, partial [Calditrichota bacterium]
MKYRFPFLTICLMIAGLFIVSCSGDSTTEPEPDTRIDTPTAYTFDSRFQDGVSSVAYSGQIVRNLLVQDLKIFIDNLGKAGASSATLQDLLNFYEYNDNLDLTTLTGAASPLLEGKYSSISTGKNLIGKISDATVIGYNKTADELIREWFALIVANSNDPAKLGTALVYTDDDGVDMTQMINKILLGAVV